VSDREVSRFPLKEGKVMHVYPFGVNRKRLQSASREVHAPLETVQSLAEANLAITTKAYYRSKPQKIRDAEAAGVPVYVLRNSTLPQMRQFVRSLFARDKNDAVKAALEEAEDAIAQMQTGEDRVELSPQSSYIRRLQHMLAERHNLQSRSTGKEPRRRVTILKDVSRG
jgi:BarA-like signal transduction histidine kinase